MCIRDRSIVFRDDSDPKETQTILRAMLEANQAVVDATSTLLGDSLIWRREDALSRLGVPASQRQGLVTAPFSKDTLFGLKPMAAVLSESEDDRLNRAIHSIAYSHNRGAGSSQKRSHLSALREAPGHSFAMPEPPQKKQRSSNRGSFRGRPSRRGRGAGKKHNPQ